MDISIETEKVKIKTEDEINISGILVKPDNAHSAILYLHMMPATKESWEPLMIFLASHGYASLAIDLRGHGESDDGPKGYTNYKPIHHQKSLNDLEAGINYLTQTFPHISKEDIILFGASIGAQLSLQYLANHTSNKIGVLLSAGLNYAEIDAIRLAPRIAGDKHILLIASHQDFAGGSDNAVQNQAIFAAFGEIF